MLMAYISNNNNYYYFIQVYVWTGMYLNY